MKTQNSFMPEDVLVPHFGTERPIVGIEIGVLGGAGSIGYLLNLPNMKLFSIDPWEHRDGEEFEASLPQDVLEKNYEEAVVRLKQFGDRSVIIRKRSDDALADVPELVEYVFIDGHHQYDQVLKDIRNYLGRVRPGGIIGGHDFMHTDVTRAVWEVFASSGKPVYLGDDTTWWVIL